MADFFQKALGAVIGTQNEREIKRLSERIPEINALEPEMQKLATPISRVIPRNSRRAWPKAPLWLNYCLRPSRSAGRPAAAH